MTTMAAAGALAALLASLFAGFTGLHAVVLVLVGMGVGMLWQIGAGRARRKEAQPR